MATLEILTLPETTMPDGNVCRLFNAANPVYFDIAKKQNLIIGSNVGTGGTLKLTVNQAIDLTVNQRLYIRGLDVSGNVIKEGWFTVIEWTMATAPYTVTLLTSQTAPAMLITQGFVNKPLSAVEKIEVTGLIEVDGNDITLMARRFSYASSGVARVYVNTMLRDELAKRYTIDYDVNNHIVSRAAFACEFDFTDVADETNVSVLITENYFAVNAVAQIGQDNRMVDFEVYNYDAIYSTARWLTAFERPVLFRGYPFGLCAVTGRNDKNVRHRIATGVTYGTFTDVNMIEIGRGVHHFKCSVSDTVQSFKTALIFDEKEKEKENNLLIEEGFKLTIDEDGSHLRID
jgi:hypothetical protein